MTFVSSRRRLVPALILALCALGMARSSAQQAGPARPLGAGDTNLITVDFLAVTADGKPVTDLKAEEVSIKVDGKARPLQSLQLVDLGGTPAGPAGAASAELPPPFATNIAAGPPGRTFFIVIDNETMRPGGEVATREAISKFLSTLSSRDQVSLMTVPHGGLSLDATNDLQKVRQTLPNLQGTAPSSETTDDATCRSRSVVEDLTAIMNGHAGSDTPMELVFVSSSLMGPSGVGTLGQTSGSRSAGTTSTSNTVAKCELLPDAFEQLRTAAAAGHVHTFVVEPQGTSTRGLNMSGSATSTTGLVTNGNNNTNNDPTVGLQNVGGQTGGPEMHLALPNETAFDRIARETSAYYVASFQTDPGEHNGMSHPLSIHIDRSGVTMRARPSVLLAKPGAGAKPGVAMSPQDMMKTTKVFRDLPVRVTGFALRNTADPKDDKVKIVAIAEPGEASVHFTAATAGLIDDKGKLVAQSSADAGALTSSPLTFAFTPRAAGKYRLRVAATDAKGRAGTTDYDLDATLVSVGPTKVSGLTFGTSAGGFKPALQFHSEPEATVYFELYGPTANGSVVVELAATPTGKAIATLTPAASPTSEPDKYIVLTQVPLATLAPGDYIVRAIVGVEGQPEARIMRTLRKVGG